jgi:Zn-dependent protease
MVDALSRRIDAGEGRPGGKKGAGVAGLGIVGLLTFIATKGKLLLVGLTKSSTFFSMLLSLGAYWSLWGWKFALGFVLSIYIHEMGHVAAMIRFGIKASVPMFIPGLGAVIRLDQYPANAREDSRIGLAGPLWGMGAALACAGVFALTGIDYWGGLAHSGGWINLFNLVPMWQLDGSRGFRSLNRPQRWLMILLVAAAFALTHDGMLVIIGLVALTRAFEKTAPRDPDWTAAVQYGLLIAVLSALVAIPLPNVPRN